MGYLNSFLDYTAEDFFEYVRTLPDQSTSSFTCLADYIERWIEDEGAKVCGNSHPCLLAVVVTIVDTWAEMRFGTDTNAEEKRLFERRFPSRIVNVLAPGRDSYYNILDPFWFQQQVANQKP